ncbi:MAG: ATP-dependent Clp protease adaptor ClpS [Sediminibacterium sp.]|jgi:ATP-dependent Clp protease adaptor protein ClpS|nr:ATP-dependent Clp protease adaptor ClpS [Chitinophagaceae bacterium]MCA6447418.1 ATP-dependent Clp protease adaptor ClpS [Chitinophagaceae bacterium]
MKPAVKNEVSPWELEETAILTDTHQAYSLIVWNDEVNTFEWVIQTLIEVCDHTEQQAEQCALFIHYKGKYPVKQGEYETLQQMCNAITNRGIGATVEVNAYS